MIRTKSGLLFLLLIVAMLVACSLNKSKILSSQKMEEVYQIIKTPFKYGIVLTAPDSTKMADSPAVFRLNDKWYMTYIIFDGKGYETWLAISDDLLHWSNTGKIMSFTENTWDASQKAGYPSLIDIDWEGTHEPKKFNGKYWVSYLGGSDKGYEAGQLGVGIAHTDDISQPKELARESSPVLTANDSSASWYDNKTIFKSSVITDKDKITGYPFVMYYNGAGDSSDVHGNHFESISLAGSDDMLHWKRIGNKPLISKGRGICGDAQIVKINDLYVMFYFGFNWRDNENNAFERFACSYDLVHWTEWNGANLIEPSVGYDQQYAHKPWVVNWQGVVYHFYNAVGKNGRVIALATSKDLRAK